MMPYLTCGLRMAMCIATAGLLLALVGGSQKHAADRNKIAVRGDPHVLIVGDPGMGKSQMLRAVCKVAPRGVYVCGNTATATGTPPTSLCSFV
jgi:DNA helicase MCM8